MLKDLGVKKIVVLRNDQFQLSDLESFDKIILSPGPGIPSEAGLLLSVVERYASTKSILGICLGEQAIGEFLGPPQVTAKNSLKIPFPSFQIRF